MQKIKIYYSDYQNITKTLSKLLQKIYDINIKTLIICSEEEKDVFDKSIWFSSGDKFIPHATDSDKYTKEQPILISSSYDNSSFDYVIYISKDFNDFFKNLQLIKGNNFSNFIYLVDKKNVFIDEVKQALNKYSFQEGEVLNYIENNQKWDVYE